MKRLLFILSLFVCLIPLLVSCTGTYTVNGNVVDKVFEAAYQEHSVIPVGAVVVPLTNDVADKWYLEIAFTDKNGQAKTFYWGVTQDVFNITEIGDDTPVNVNGDILSGVFWWWMLPLIGITIVFMFKAMSKMNRGDEVGDEDEEDEYSWDDEDDEEDIEVGGVHKDVLRRKSRKPLSLEDEEQMRKKFFEGG